MLAETHPGREQVVIAGSDPGPATRQTNGADEPEGIGAQGLERAAYHAAGAAQLLIAGGGEVPGFLVAVEAVDPPDGGLIAALELRRLDPDLGTVPVDAGIGLPCRNEDPAVEVVVDQVGKQGPGQHQAALPGTRGVAEPGLGRPALLIAQGLPPVLGVEQGVVQQGIAEAGPGVGEGPEPPGQGPVESELPGRLGDGVVGRWALARRHALVVPLRAQGSDRPHL